MRFSSEYECLESELAKAQSIHGSSQPDWRKVLETSELMLRHQSKDLRSAVWLTWALHQCESYTGLLAGLGLPPCAGLRLFLIDCLHKNRGNRTRTARELGVARRTLLYRLARLKIPVGDVREEG